MFTEMHTLYEQVDDSERGACLAAMDNNQRKATASLLPRTTLVKALAQCVDDEAKKCIETCACEMDPSGSAKRESVRKAASCVAMEGKAMAQALVSTARPHVAV